MELKYSVMTVVLAVLVIAVGCAKVPQTEQPESLEPTVSDVYRGFYELDLLDEEVGLEEIEINPDELSGLDF